MKLILPFITIVSGVPRSGTSMMMKVLEAGGMGILADNVRGADSDNPNGYYEYEPVKRTRSDHRWTLNAEGRAVKVVHLLLHHLPRDKQYRVIFIHRDLQEVVASQQKMLRNLKKQGASLSDEELALALGTQVEKTLTWVRRQGNMQLLEVHYSKMIADPLSEIARVAELISAPLDLHAMTCVVDSSLYRQRHMESEKIDSQLRNL